MHPYHHHVSGIFQQHNQAAFALMQLNERGLPLKRMHIFEDTISLPATTEQGQSNKVLKNMLVKGGVGAVKSVSKHTDEKEGFFSDFISDAIASGQVVLAIEPRNKEETVMASEVIKLSVNHYQDVSVT
jgi:hypothetical protein